MELDRKLLMHIAHLLLTTSALVVTMTFDLLTRKPNETQYSMSPVPGTCDLISVKLA